MFRIGEFSKIAQTTVKQLRYYDEIELFQPEHIDQFTGYRYYRATQLPDLNRILVMKGLGLTLDQIQKLVVDQISADEIRGMLSLKKAQIEQELHNQIEQLHHIEARLRQVEKDGVLSNDDIVLKELPVQPIFSYIKSFTDVRHAVQDRVQLSRLLPKQVSKKNLGHFLAIMQGDGFAMQDVSVEMGFMLNEAIDEPLTLSTGDTLSTHVLPRVPTAACAVRVGGFENGYDCYGNLGRWLEANDYKVAGKVREVFIKQVPMDRIDEMVCEIQIPVEPISPKVLNFLN